MARLLFRINQWNAIVNGYCRRELLILIEEFVRNWGAAGKPNQSYSLSVIG